MTVVELIARLEAAGCHLLGWDTFGPAWSAPPPIQAMPWITLLRRELATAAAGAVTGHRWAQCNVCGHCQLTARRTASQNPALCRLTPRCTGQLDREAIIVQAERAAALRRSERKRRAKASQGDTPDVPMMVA